MLCLKIPYRQMGKFCVVLIFSSKHIHYTIQLLRITIFFTPIIFRQQWNSQSNIIHVQKSCDLCQLNVNPHVSQICNITVATWELKISILKVPPAFYQGDQLTMKISVKYIMAKQYDAT